MNDKKPDTQEILDKISASENYFLMKGKDFSNLLAALLKTQTAILNLQTAVLSIENTTDSTKKMTTTSMSNTKEALYLLLEIVDGIDFLDKKK